MGNAVNNREDLLPDFAHNIVAITGIIDPEMEEILANALAFVDRRRFFPDIDADKVLSDTSLPYAGGTKTLMPSQIVRLMALAGLDKNYRVLICGLDSPYTLALVSAVGCSVFCVEDRASIVRFARKQLDSLGYQHILIRQGPIEKGWSVNAPYDVSIFCRPIRELSEKVINQVRKGGALVCPIEENTITKLNLFVRTNEGLKRIVLEEWKG